MVDPEWCNASNTSSIDGDKPVYMQSQPIPIEILLRSLSLSKFKDSFNDTRLLKADDVFLSTLAMNLRIQSIYGRSLLGIVRTAFMVEDHPFRLATHQEFCCACCWYEIMKYTTKYNTTPTQPAFRDEFGFSSLPSSNRYIHDFIGRHN
jgi:hypothetical protein